MGKVCHRAHTGKSNRHPCRSETLARCRQRQLVSAYCLYDECRRRSKQRMVGSRIGERLQPTAIKFKQDKLRKWNLEKSLKMYTFANKRYPQDDNIRMIFHFLDTDIQPPLRFNNPFYYEPHPLCVLAAKELQQHLSSLKLNEGKMFGVLVVQTQEGILGYIAAYSGQLILKEQKEGNLGNHRKSRFSFVPAVFDYLQPDGYFKVHEAEITSINEEISKQTSSPEYKRILEDYHT